MIHGMNIKVQYFLLELKGVPNSSSHAPNLVCLCQQNKEEMDQTKKKVISIYPLNSVPMEYNDEQRFTWGIDDHTSNHLNNRCQERQIIYRPIHLYTQNLMVRANHGNFYSHLFNFSLS